MLELKDKTKPRKKLKTSTAKKNIKNKNQTKQKNQTLTKYQKYEKNLKIWAHIKQRKILNENKSKLDGDREEINVINRCFTWAIKIPVFFYILWQASILHLFKRSSA